MQSARALTLTEIEFSHLLGWTQRHRKINAFESNLSGKYDVLIINDAFNVML